MKFNRHNEVPVYTTFEGKVDANHYNHVQIALKRLGEEIRFQIPKLKSLQMILQKDAWIVVDRAFNDLPVVAWTDFQTQGRDSLHEPIPCRIRYFHASAAIILRRTLEAMDVIIEQRLLESVQNNHKVLIFEIKQDAE